MKEGPRVEIKGVARDKDVRRQLRQLEEGTITNSKVETKRIDESEVKETQ